MRNEIVNVIGSSCYLTILYSRSSPSDKASIVWASFGVSGSTQLAMVLPTSRNATTVFTNCILLDAIVSLCIWFCSSQLIG